MGMERADLDSAWTLAAALVVFFMHSPWAAAALGGACGLFASWVIGIWPRLGLDDPTEYVTMNVLAALWACSRWGCWPRHR